jgi:hypothetical protein
VSSCYRLPLRGQVLGDLGLALQPGQPRLLVQASHLLAGGQARAHDRDDLAIGGRRLCSSARSGATPGRRASARVSTGYEPLPWPRATWQSAHISTVNRLPTLLNGPAVDPQKEQQSAIVPCDRTCVRLMLRRLVPAVSRLSATIPRVASRRTTAPRSESWLSRADVVPGEALKGCVKWCGRHGMQGVWGSAVGEPHRANAGYCG